MLVMSKHFQGLVKFDPQLEHDRAATVYARDHEEARALLDDAADYIYLLMEDAKGDDYKMLEAAMNLAGGALEFLEDKARLSAWDGS